MSESESNLRMYVFFMFSIFFTLVCGLALATLYLDGVLTITRIVAVGGIPPAITGVSFHSILQNQTDFPS
jgi:hypothetical protein